jgi:uncharacterized protein YjbJ (UPF0337 family)
MNSNILHGKWMQLKGEVKKTWGKLTDDDLDQVEGDSIKLAGLLEEKYGYSKEKAQKEIDEFQTKMEKNYR